MEIITRTIIRERNGRELAYKFQATSLIFIYSAADVWLDSLLIHLKRAFMYGPEISPKSPSDEPGLMLDVVPYAGEDAEHLMGLIGESGYHGYKGKQHEVVQDYLMKNDPYTLACEAPVWNSEYTGSIDVVRYFPGRQIVQIVDFKPKAKKEKKVTGQLFKYAQLLSENSGFPMSRMELIYCDENNAYQIIL